AGEPLLRLLFGKHDGVEVGAVQRLDADAAAPFLLQIRKSDPSFQRLLLDVLSQRRGSDVVLLAVQQQLSLLEPSAIHRLAVQSAGAVFEVAVKLPMGKW